MPLRERRLIRSATLEGYPDAAQAVGLVGSEMLGRVGLNLSCLNDHDTLISLDAFLELLALSAREANCPDFGVRAAIARGVPDLGAVSLLMREAESVEKAIRLYGTHLSLHSDGTYIQLNEDRENPIIVMEVSGRTREQSIQAVQFCATGVTLQLRWLIGSDFEPELVSFSHARPAHARVMPRFFQCPISYNQAVSGIVIDRALLSRPPVTSLPFLRELTRKHLAPAIACSPQGFGTKVARVVKQMLPDGFCCADGVARYFGIDRRTLNRRLAREAETFSSVLQRVRVETVEWEIDYTEFSLTELSDLAGFQSLSSFSRWFQKSFGCSATQWRRGRRVAAATAADIGSGSARPAAAVRGGLAPA